jgi:hypothetical protein
LHFSGKGSLWAHGGAKTQTIWQALDGWGKQLKPWQRYILVHAISIGRLNDDQIGNVFELFLEAFDLAKPQRRFIQFLPQYRAAQQKLYQNPCSWLE